MRDGLTSLARAVGIIAICWQLVCSGATAVLLQRVAACGAAQIAWDRCGDEFTPPALMWFHLSPLYWVTKPVQLLLLRMS